MWRQPAQALGSGGVAAVGHERRGADRTCIRRTIYATETARSEAVLQASASENQIFNDPPPVC